MDEGTYIVVAPGECSGIPFKDWPDLNRPVLIQTLEVMAPPSG